MEAICGSEEKCKLIITNAYLSQHDDFNFGYKPTHKFMLHWIILTIE